MVNLPSSIEAEKTLSNCGYVWLDTPFTCIPLQGNSIDMSIIVPVYNSEKYLRKCLLSLLNQETKYKYEIVCVNDGSIDSSLDIINELKAQYSELISVFSQRNGGIAAARNKGIELAKGEYIGFVDNDDFVSSDYVEKVISMMKMYDADMIQTGH